MPDVEQAPVDIESVQLGAEALLREHPDALVCGLAGDGLIVPVPGSLGLRGHSPIEGRAVIDGVVVEDRAKVIELWMRTQRYGAANGKVRLLDDRSRWMTLHFLDLRADHNVLLCILIPGEEVAEGEDRAELEVGHAAPRFCTLVEDEGANVLECDEAFTQMFGYSAEEVVGKHVLDHLHPEDQGRAVEGWLAMLATRRPHHMRCRRARKDGSWMWIDTTLHNYLNEADRNHVLVEIIDVSAEMAAQEALQEREELLRRITEGMPVGLLQLDTDRNVVHHNARLSQILESAPEGTAGASSATSTSEQSGAVASTTSLETLLSTLTEAAAAGFNAALANVVQEGVDQDVEVDVVPARGASRRALLSIRALLRPDGEVGGTITCVLDVTDSARAREELERRATYDGLTNCHNRSSVLAALERELEGSTRAEMAVVYVDLDRFKQVNDSLGHAVGDDVLVMVAERLRAATRHGTGRTDDIVGRLGGDEFLLLIRGLPEPELAMSVAGRIRESLRSPLELASGKLELSASLGVAWAGDQEISADELIKRADEAMYRSKEQRQGEPVLASPALGA